MCWFHSSQSAQPMFYIDANQGNIRLSLCSVMGFIYMLRTDGMAEWVEHPYPILRDQRVRSSQSNDLKINICHLLTRHFVLLGQSKDWFAKCQDNVTEWDFRAWCWQSEFPVGQHSQVAMSVYYHKSVSVLKCPSMLSRRKTPTIKQSACLS